MGCRDVWKNCRIINKFAKSRFLVRFSLADMMSLFVQMYLVWKLALGDNFLQKKLSAPPLVNILDILLIWRSSLCQPLHLCHRPSFRSCVFICRPCGSQIILTVVYKNGDYKWETRTKRRSYSWVPIIWTQIKVFGFKRKRFTSSNFFIKKIQC